MPPRVWPLAIGAMCFACSLFTDLSALEEPPDALADGGADATTSGDAAPANDGGSKVGCDATFCETFDEGPFGAQWTETVQSGGGMLAVLGRAHNGTNVMRATTPFRVDGGGSRHAYLA